jgi:hypothetical protein
VQWLLPLTCLHSQLVCVSHKLPHFFKVICAFKIERSKTSEPCKQTRGHTLDIAACHIVHGPVRLARVKC